MKRIYYLLISFQSVTTLLYNPIKSEHRKLDDDAVYKYLKTYISFFEYIHQLFSFLLVYGIKISYVEISILFWVNLK